MRASISTLLMLASASFTVAQINYCRGDPSNVGHCTTLTYTDLTTTVTNPPNSTDCYNTCFGINADAGDWIVDFKGQIKSLFLPRAAVQCLFNSHYSLCPGNTTDFTTLS